MLVFGHIKSWHAKNKNKVVLLGRTEYRCCYLFTRLVYLSLFTCILLNSPNVGCIVYLQLRLLAPKCFTIFALFKEIGYSLLQVLTNNWAFKSRPSDISLLFIKYLLQNQDNKIQFNLKEVHVIGALTLIKKANNNKLAWLFFSFAPK